MLVKGAARKGEQAQQQKPSHESKATLITQRRLAVLTESLQLDHVPQFEIIDEQDEQGQPAGTTVRFYFPNFKLPS